MKVGIIPINIGATSGDQMVQLAQLAESLGYESAWTFEHVIVPMDYASKYPYNESGKMGAAPETNFVDPLIALTAIAASTKTIRLGTGVNILSQVNPLYMAKQAASLDFISGGRFMLGVGIGWLREEFEMIGADFETRAARTDEYIHALRALWEQEAPSFEGDFVSFKEAYCRPQPAQGTVPIIIGGHSPAAARRAGRLGDGFFPAREISSDLLDVVYRTAEEHGRDPETIEITTSIPETLDQLPALRALGVHRIMLPVNPTSGMY